jgi:integrase
MKLDTKLTDSLARSLKLPRSRTDEIFWDGALAGFGLRVYASGVRAWLLQYDRGTSIRKMTLGSIEALSASRARTTAMDLLAKVRLGESPADDKRDARSEANETFGKPTLLRYLAHKRATLRPGSFAEVERHLTTHAASLHRRPLADIDRKTVAALLSKIAAENGVATCNRVRSSLAAYFTWLMTEGLADSNPVTDIAKRQEGGGRSRVLSLPELAAILKAADDGTDHGDIVWLLALTGLRRSEIGDLVRDELDVDAATITIPASRMKANHSHTVPLSPRSLAILQRRADRPGALFGRFGERGGFSGWSRSKERLDQKLNLAPWTVHDIRRSVATHMGELLDVPPHIIAELLAHRTFRAGVEHTYNRSVYQLQKAAALTRWADLLTTAVDGAAADVVPMVRPAR